MRRPRRIAMTRLRPGVSVADQAAVVVELVRGQAGALDPLAPLEPGRVAGAGVVVDAIAVGRLEPAQESPFGVHLGQARLDDLTGPFGRNQGWIDYSVDPPVVNLNQPQVIAAVKQISDLIKLGVIFYSNATSSDAILTGHMALWFGTEDVSTGFSILPAKININVAPIPQGIEEVFYGTPSESLRTGLGLFISRTTKNTQACWEWVSFLSADSTSFLGVPVRRSVSASANWEARVGAQNAAVYRAALARIPTAHDYAWNDKIEAYQNNLEILFLHNVLGKIVIGGGDPVTTIAEEQRAIDTYLACIAPLSLSSVQTTPGMSQQITDCLQKADPYNDSVMFT